MSGFWGGNGGHSDEWTRDFIRNGTRSERGGRRRIDFYRVRVSTWIVWSLCHFNIFPRHKSVVDVA